jgi:hypothetical protein
MNRFWDSKLTGAPPLLSWVVPATLRVAGTAPRLRLLVRDAKRVPNQRLHLPAAPQTRLLRGRR